jgi:uncharacterized protein
MEGATGRPRLDLRAVLVFILLAFGLAWLVALPLWLGEGLREPLFVLYAIGMMCTPAVAALVVARWIERTGPGAPSLACRLGLRPIVPFGRLALFLLLGLLLPVLLVMAGLVLGTWFGVYRADLEGFSGFRMVLQQQAALFGTELPEVPMGLLVAAQFGNIAIGSLINLLPALGEELGWRGWLVPKLQPLGTLGMVLVSGLVWGLWHAPLILLGYNYPAAPPLLGVLAMCGTTISFGALLAWLRLASNSVWPAALAHGALNASAGLAVVFSAAFFPLDSLRVAPLGWTGWILPLVLAGVLLATRGRRTGVNGAGRGGPGFR